MISNFYASYKRANSILYYEIPTHWEELKLKFFVTYKKGRNPVEMFTDLDNAKIYLSMEYLRNDYDRIFYVKDYTNLVIIDDNEILLLWDGANAGEFIKSKSGILSSTMAVLKIKDIDLSYSWYLFKIIEPILRAFTIGMGIPHVNSTFFSNLLLCIPSLPEQQSIASFLDYKTSQIDTLVEKKENLLNLLEEKRIALITQAVTKSLDPNVKMKPSGIDWLGEIPRHWQVKRLRFLLTNGFSNGIFKKNDEWGEGIKIINVSDVYVKNFLVDINNLDSVNCSSEEFLTYKVKEGDFFFVRSSLKLEGIGQSASFIDNNRNSEPLVFECHLVKGSPDKSIINYRFLNLFLNSSLAKNIFISKANTVTMTTIDQMKFKDIFICYPSLDEQEKIIDYINIEFKKIDSLSKKIEENIGYLKEYRTSLITSAVTGKIDVRNWSSKREKKDEILETLGTELQKD